MSIIYQGPTTELILLPEDDLSIQPSRLATLRRSYACATSYAATARGVLVPGHVPSGYANMALFSKPSESTSDGGITKFTCTYYGVITTGDYNTPQIARGSEVRTFTIPGTTPISGKYIAPTYTQRFVRSSATALSLSIPSLATIKPSTLLLFGASSGTPTESSLGTISVTVQNVSEVEYGVVTEVSTSFSISTIYG
jgi:hypothetical protein